MIAMQILLIDNYDSFTHNLFHLMALVKGVEVIVRRNDEDLLTAVKEGAFDAIVIGPGPGSPDDDHYFGQCRQVILECSNRGIPLLGICLGFQGIAHVFGASLRRAVVPVHGKMSELEILKSDTLFSGVANGVEVMRYHSLMLDTRKWLGKDLVVTAEVAAHESSVAQNGREIMAIEHADLPIYGVQFHPESFATESGLVMIENFVSIARRVTSNVQGSL